MPTPLDYLNQLRPDPFAYSPTRPSPFAAAPGAPGAPGGFSGIGAESVPPEAEAPLGRQAAANSLLRQWADQEAAGRAKMATPADIAGLATAPEYGPLRKANGTPARGFTDAEMADVNSGAIQLRPGDFTSMPQGGKSDPSLSPAGAALTGKGMVPIGGFLPGTATPIAAGSEWSFAQSATSPMSWQAILNSVPTYSHMENGVLSSYRDPQALAAAMHFMGQQQATEASSRQAIAKTALGWAELGNEQKKTGLLERQIDPEYLKAVDAQKFAAEQARQNKTTEQAGQALNVYSAATSAAKSMFPGQQPAAAPKPPTSPAGTPPANQPPAPGPQAPGAGATPQNPILAAQALANQKAQQWGPEVQGLFDKLSAGQQSPEEFWAAVHRTDRANPGLMERAGPQIIDQFKGVAGEDKFREFTNPGFFAGMGHVLFDAFRQPTDADMARVALRKYMGQVRRPFMSPNFDGGPAHPSAAPR
jgi:hypothetical protein